eukprot:scaffold28709_cov52-Cyclotella_meneghiniana.AAC.3
MEHGARHLTSKDIALALPLVGPRKVRCGEPEIHKDRQIGPAASRDMYCPIGPRSMRFITIYNSPRRVIEQTYIGLIHRTH